MACELELSLRQHSYILYDEETLSDSGRPNSGRAGITGILFGDQV